MDTLTLAGINTILTTLATFNPISLAIISIIGALIFLSVHNSRLTSRTIKISKLHDKLFAQWLSFVDGKLLEVITTVTDKARIIIDREYTRDLELCSECKTPKKHNDPQSQLSIFNNRLRDTLLYSEVKYAIKLAYKQNGFSEMDNSEYRQYIADKSASLLSLTLDSIHRTINDYSYLTGKATDIFNKSDTFDIVMAIFDKAKSIKVELIESEKQIVAETSLLPTRIAKLIHFLYKSSV